jgi:5-formyltetrahydrofolate cyclo-ligase
MSSPDATRGASSEAAALAPSEATFAQGEDVLRRRVKGELRKRLRGLRKTTPPEACAERSKLIVAALLEQPALSSTLARGGAPTVALFWPMMERHEVDLRPLDAALRAKGAKVAYPAIAEDGDMVFRIVLDPSAMVERGHMFAEPGEEEALVGGDGRDLSSIDVMVVPALAVDPSGHRIGYGAGYYDRALARLSPTQVTIAVAYDFQLISEVPVTAGDLAVGFIVTDHRVLQAIPRTP